MPQFRFHKLLKTSTSRFASVLFVLPVFSRAKRMTSTFVIEERGKLYTESYRLYFKNSANEVVSPFHDIPLKPIECASSEAESVIANDLFNMIVEVPKWSNAKMEISKSKPMNPIMQDVKKGKVRFVGNVFPHRGYIWNYGAFPQTWEDPTVAHSETATTGDNDPLDVCDISNIISPRGAVIQVKVLGVLLMIDEGETDWKIIAINSADPFADHMEDITDVEKYKPGLLHATIEWFKYYKVPDGKPTNSFGFKNQFKNRKFALDVITETNHQWQKLLSTPQEEGSEDFGIFRASISVNESPFVITSEQSQEYLDNEPAYDMEPAHIECAKAFDSFFVNGSTIQVTREVEVTSMDACGDTLESPAVVENGEEASEPASEAEVPATEEGEAEVAAVKPNDTEETGGDAKVENVVQNGHDEDTAACNEGTAESLAEEATPEEPVKEKPTEAMVQEATEGIAEESK